MFNIIKMALNFALVILATFLAIYSFSANSEENSTQNESKSTSIEESIKAQEEINRLQKQIEEQQEKYITRPRRKFVGARTKDHQLAYYSEKWRQKVEKIGNQYYPKAAAQRHIQGKVQVTVSIMADGTVESIEINKSSGHKVLDDHVVETLKRASPYDKFDDNLKKDVDILSVTRTWQYISQSDEDGAQNWFLVEVEN